MGPCLSGFTQRLTSSNTFRFGDPLMRMVIDQAYGVRFRKTSSSPDGSASSNACTGSGP